MTNLHCTAMHCTTTTPVYNTMQVRIHLAKMEAEDLPGMFYFSNDEEKNAGIELQVGRVGYG